MTWFAGNLSDNSATTSTLVTTFTRNIKSDGTAISCEQRVGALIWSGASGISVTFDGRLRKTYSHGKPLEACERCGIAEEVLSPVEPMAIEAALEAERRHMDKQGEGY